MPQHKLHKQRSMRGLLGVGLCLNLIFKIFLKSYFTTDFLENSNVFVHANIRIRRMTKRTAMLVGYKVILNLRIYRCFNIKLYCSCLPMWQQPLWRYVWKLHKRHGKLYIQMRMQPPFTIRTYLQLYDFIIVWDNRHTIKSNNLYYREDKVRNKHL